MAARQCPGLRRYVTIENSETFAMMRLGGTDSRLLRYDVNGLLHRRHQREPTPLRAGPPIDQRLKLLSYLHVQLHDTNVGLTLAAVLGSDREAPVFLRLVENGKQLGFGIDHHGDALRALMPETTEPHDCSTFLQSLEYVDDGHAPGYQPHYLKGRAAN